MSANIVPITLKNFGLTNKEVETYILLSKKGPTKGTELAKIMKRNKGQIYRILKSLQKKGFVESTLEFPKRFLAVNFEKIIKNYVKAKRDELSRIEDSTKDLLNDWEKINKTGNEYSLEKFVVIEGNKKIYQRIAEMLENTQNTFLGILSVADLGRAEQSGVFESAYESRKKSTTEFRFITDLTEQNLKAAKLLQPKLKIGLDVKARNPDLGLALFPRMVIRDSQEILFFISTKNQNSTKKQDACIFTNSESMVHAFASVFKELWWNSTNIDEKINEIETGRPTTKTLVINDAKVAKEKYNQILFNTEKEIIMITSSSALSEICENIFSLKELAKRNISIKIMAPIRIENVEHAKLLSEFSDVRHIPSTYLGTTIIDGRHLFQFKVSLKNESELGNVFSFKNAFYTSDSAYVEKMKSMLDNIWRRAYKPWKALNQSIGKSNIISRFNLDTKRDLGKLPQNLLLAAQTHGNITGGIGGEIIVEPPSRLNMPTLRILPLRFEHAHSRKGVNLLRIDLWLNSPNGEEFVPVAIVTDAIQKVIERSKTQFAGTPAAENHISVKPQELQVWNKGKSLFAGWTIPIPLLGSKFVLDPACIMFEAFGDEIHSTISYQLPSGYLMGIEWDGFQAFTTYIGPSWKYSGPGIYGSVGNFLLVVAKPEIT